MNKSDVKLIIGLALFSIIMIGLIVVTKTDDKKVAKIYYENNLVLTIPLEPEKKEIYTVQGYNGTVLIEIDNQRLRVIEEESPLHLCSKQGFIKETYETIVCLPNKVVIEIEASTDLDAVVK